MKKFGKKATTRTNNMSAVGAALRAHSLYSYAIKNGKFVNGAATTKDAIQLMKRRLDLRVGNLYAHELTVYNERINKM
jgi:hypothetical protein